HGERAFVVGQRRPVRAAVRRLPHATLRAVPVYDVRVRGMHGDRRQPAGRLDGQARDVARSERHPRRVGTRLGERRHDGGPAGAVLADRRLERAGRDLVERECALVVEVVPAEARVLDALRAERREGEHRRDKRGGYRDRAAADGTHGHRVSCDGGAARHVPVRRNRITLLVPAAVVTVTSYSPGGSTSGGASPVAGSSLGTGNRIRVPPSVERRSGRLTGPKRTTFPASAKPVPTITASTGKSGPAGASLGTSAVITGDAAVIAAAARGSGVCARMQPPAAITPASSVASGAAAHRGNGDCPDWRKRRGRAGRSRRAAAGCGTGSGRGAMAGEHSERELERKREELRRKGKPDQIGRPYETDRELVEEGERKRP